jgi:hypothetical protein
MQDTFGEWRRSGTQKTCIDCHFPNGDHQARGGHDLALLQQTLRVTWTGRCAVIEARDAGHAVPTGDPFHALRLSLCADASCDEVLASKPLMRRFAPGPDGLWANGLDTRPQPRHEVCFQAAEATHWRLEMSHAEPEIAPIAPSEERWRLIHSGAFRQ